jgi:multidrug transporter EmrE-like cation transporter
MEEEKSQDNNINSDKYEKYKEMFDKHKNEDGMLSEEGINNILNECGRKTTLKESEELIKRYTRNTENTTINFDNFVKLMKIEEIDNLEENKVAEKPKTLTDCQIYFFMFFLLITGSINTIANKLQQNTTSKGVKYKGHQKFITFCMFNGEFVCLLIYWLKEGRFKKKQKSESLISNAEEKNNNNKKEPKIWYFLFPAIFDILGSSISSISLTFLPTSIYQMFRGAIIIFTCTASILFLKNKYYKHHFLGIVIVILGLIIVGLDAVINGDSSEGENPAFGIFLVVLSQVFSCFLFITEEKLLK